MLPATQRCLSLPSKPRSASGKLFLFTLLKPFSALLSGFLQADPFQSIISSKTALERREKGPGEGGERAKKVWNLFYRPWHPWTAVTWCFGLSSTLSLSHALPLMTTLCWETPPDFPIVNLFTLLTYIEATLR